MKTHPATSRLVTRIVAGYPLTLEAGVSYVASRPFARRGAATYDVTIEPWLRTDLAPVVLPALSYDEANRVLAAFNTGTFGFEGRIW